MRDIAINKKDGAAFWDIFLQRNATGEYIYSDDDIRSFLPVLYLMLYQVMGKECPLAVQAELHKMLEEIGIAGDADQETVQKGVNAYFEAHPVNQNLQKAFDRFVLENFKKMDPNELGHSFEAFADSRKIIFDQDSQKKTAKKPGGALSLFMNTKVLEEK